MDINKIFGAFGSSSKDEGMNWNYYQSPTSKKTIDENHPRYYIKMFSKLINNYTAYNQQLIKFFGSSDPELDTQEIEKTGDMMLYNRAYVYLTEIDLQDEYHIRILFEEVNPNLNSALNKSLNFFEKEEEYEKCAVLKKYLDFLNLSS